MSPTLTNDPSVSLLPTAKFIDLDQNTSGLITLGNTGQSNKEGDLKKPPSQTGIYQQLIISGNDGTLETLDQKLGYLGKLQMLEE